MKNPKLLGHFRALLAKIRPTKIQEIWLPSVFSSHKSVHPCKKSVKNNELTCPILELIMSGATPCNIKGTSADI